MKRLSHCVIVLVLAAMVQGNSHAQFVQQGAKLVGSGSAGVSGINQGQSVSLSADGNTAMIGGYNDADGQGASWVFTRTGTTWSQQGAKLVGTGVAFAAYQGYAVSLSADGNTALVGGILDNNGIGATWAFTRSAGVWNQQGEKLVGTGGVTAFGEEQGVSVSLSADGNTALVGGFQDSSQAGAAWVFTRTDTVWSQQGGKLVGSGAVGNPIFQGYAVALSGDGNTAIIGGYADNAQAGAAWVFTRSGGVWSQQGSKLVGTGATGPGRFGFSVALSADGNTALIGGTGDNGGAGAVWVFTRSDTVWSQQGAKLVGTGASGIAQQGWSVSLSADGNTAVVGAYLDNGGVGATWVYGRSAGVWTQRGSKLVGTGAVGLSRQGQSVSLSGDGSTAIVGGFQDNTNMGASWVFVPGVPDTLVNISVIDKWNMISVPLSVNDYSKTVLFPTATTSAYAYGAGYSSAPTLVNGSSYWVKFSGVQSVPMTGRKRTRDTIAVVEGWNMIGSISVPCPVSAITSNPAGIVTGSFFSYSGDYHVSSVIEPGNGYWVKAAAAGELILDGGATVSPESRIRIMDTGEPPPPPPNARISSAPSMPREFALNQNYPNPFNPTTTISYSIPRAGLVTLIVYDMLGQAMATLVNEVQAEGERRVSFDATRLSTGVYTYRLTAGTLTQARSMMLIR